MSWATPEACKLAGAVAVERTGDELIAARSLIDEIPGLRPQLVCPGDLVSAEVGCLRGKGIMERPDGKLVATIVGVVEQVNKLIYVRALNHRYLGSIGDVVVGRIVEVCTDRWSVQIGTSTLAGLHLGAIQLPNNEQRKRTDEDSLRMREFYVETDIIVAEVQKAHENGELSLQTRNNRYGKLQNGVLAKIPSMCVRRQANHMVTLQGIGLQVVLGNNGYIWICAPPKVAGSGKQETLNFSQMDVRYEQVHDDLRGRICRARNVVMHLAACGLEVTPESITYAYEQSVQRGLLAWELLDPARCDNAGLTEAIIEEFVGIADRGADR